MKKAVFVICMLCVCGMIAFCFAGCGGDDGVDVLIDAGKDAVVRMKEAVCSEVYREWIAKGLLTSDNDDMVGIVENEDVTAVKAIYEISFDSELVLSEMSSDVTSEKLGALPDRLRKRLNDLSGSYILQFINTKNSEVKKMAFATIFGESGNMIYDMPSGKRVFIYVFESGYPVWASFSASGNGIVTYSTQWILADCEKLTSEDAVMTELGLDKIKTVSIEKIR